MIKYILDNTYFKASTSIIFFTIEFDFQCKMPSGTELNSLRKFLVDYILRKV